MTPNKEIFVYTDYRKFLRDYYTSRKKGSSHFSYQLLAQRAGLASASFIRMVMEGTKNLTRESACKIAGALRLNKKASEYFENLVLFNQAKDFETKELYLKKIDRFRKRNKPELLRPKKYDYLKNWLHAVIREVVEFPDFKEDTQDIARRFAITVNQQDIQKSIDFLLENGFLGRDTKGKLFKKEKTISTIDIPHNEELIIIAKKYHSQILELALTALLEMPKEQRSVTNTTLSFSKQSYELALKRIENLRYELLELAAADDHVDRVYQLNINLFPLVISKDE